jgi:hypothetical protein
MLTTKERALILTKRYGINITQAMEQASTDTWDYDTSAYVRLKDEASYHAWLDELEELGSK